MLLEATAPLIDPPQVTVFGPGASTTGVAIFSIAAVIVYGLYLLGQKWRWEREQQRQQQQHQQHEQDMKDRDRESTGGRSVNEALVNSIIDAVVKRVHDSTRKILGEELESVLTVLQNLHSVMATLESTLSKLSLNEERQTAALTALADKMAAMTSNINQQATILATIDRTLAVVNDRLDRNGGK